MDGNACSNETGYFIEIFEVTCTNCTSVVSGTYYSSWFSGEVGIINLSTIYGSFQSGKIYRIKLAVANNLPNSWNEKVMYTTICTPSFTLSSNICASAPVAFDGTATTNETGYFIEIYETNSVNGTTVTGPYFSNWYTGQAGVRNLKDIFTFQPGKVYRVKLAVNSIEGCGWLETSKWTTIASGCREGDFAEIESVDLPRIYSNPAIDDFSVDVPYSNEVATIRLSTIDGIVIKEMTSYASIVRMSITEVPSGMYLVRIVQGNSVVTKKLQVIK